MDNRALASSNVHLSDSEAKIAELCNGIKATLRRTRTMGCVVAVSGGVDSSVCLALATKAVGARRVVGIALPDKDSSTESLSLARMLCLRLDVPLVVKDISTTLDELGCYSRQTEAVQSLHPQYSPELDRFSVALKQDFANTQSLPTFSLVLQGQSGQTHVVRLTPDAYNEIVAATNMKQRTRMLLTHAEAERRRYAVIGTSNLVELSQGFVVRYGDATGDYLPLRSLLKTQVYDVAESLDLPSEITSRMPTTDTYSGDQTQEDFFYGLPTMLNDILWHNYCHGVEASTVSSIVGLSETFVSNAFDAFSRRAKLSERLLFDSLK